MSKHININFNDCGIEHYDIKDVIVREDIMAKAKELAELISTSDEVKIYQQAEKQVNENDRIQSLISQIKKKQKEVVAFESFQNAEMVKKIEGEQQELQDELDGIPIVQQFKQTQSDINYMLQLVISIIKDSLTEKIQLESGHQAPPTSCND